MLKRTRGKVANVVILGKAKQKLVPTHSQLQISCLDWVRAKYPQYIDLFVKISNEGKRSWVEGKKQKAEGLNKGASDLFFALPKWEENRISYCGWWIEFKKHGDKETKEQALFGGRMIDNYYTYSVIYTIEEFIEQFEWYIDRKDCA